MKINIYSFKYRLAFSYVFIILISLGFIAFFLDRKLEENSIQDIKTSIINQAYLIESQIPQENLIKENTSFLNSIIKSLSHKIKCRITVLNKTGKVLADSEKTIDETLKMENHADRPEIKIALSDSIGEEIRYSKTLGIDMLYIALPIKNDKEIIGVLRLALPLSDLKEMLFIIRKAVLFSLLFALALAVVLGAILTRGMVKPINKMIYVANKFSNGDFSHKISISSKDELGELASVLNKMAKNLEDKIREIEIKNQHLVAILESMVEGIIVVDKTSRIVSVNSTVENIFNISKKNLEGKIFLEVIRNNDISDIISAVLKKAEFTSRELNLMWPVQKIFQINASPIFEKGEVSGCILVIHDITEIRRLETMRRDFVANVSHELKTPLTSIKGFIETLIEGAIDDKENNRHFLNIIQEHAERLNKLVDDLLSLSHLESKEKLLRKDIFNLYQQVGKVITNFGAQLKKKNIEIKNELPVNISVNADKDKIEGVLTNLIDNAIKFNREKGAIRIYNHDQK